PNALHRYSSAQCHADTVAGIFMVIGGLGVNAPCTTGRQNSRRGIYINWFTISDIDRDNTVNYAILVFYQANSEPLIQKNGLVFDIALIERVQKCMTATVSCSASTGCLGTLAKIFRLATKRTLVNTALFGARERQAHMFQFEHGFRPH